MRANWEGAVQCRDHTNNSFPKKVGILNILLKNKKNKKFDFVFSNNNLIFSKIPTNNHNIMHIR